MNSNYGAPAYGGNTMGYSTVESLLEDVSRQMASSNLTRYSHSRGSAGQRGSAGSMRIAKPNSTSNSPRGSVGLGRRRTVMTDRRRIAMADQPMTNGAGFVSNDGLQIHMRSNRPVSWHPSSQMAPPPQFHSAYQVPPLQAQPDYHLYNHPSTPAVYSGYGSPDSTFSPLSRPFTGNQQDYHPGINVVPYQSKQEYQTSQPAQAPMPYYSTQATYADSSISHMDWNNFAASGFGNSTSPPTPEFFLPIQPEGPLPADDAIPYHSLSDSEPEGEVLQGLGLYDAPEAPKFLSSTAHFDNYRALVMSQLLGSACRKYEPESTGKGLKLEETWNPPPSDDEDDDEDDDEQDGEGEDDDEQPTHHSHANVKTTQGNTAFMSAPHVIPNGREANQDLHCSWL